MKISRVQTTLRIMARLYIQLGGSDTVSRELAWGITRVGRAPDNDLMLDHPSVSHHHCELELGFEGLKVRDLGSTNGTYLSGRIVSQADVPSGGTLRFGDLQASVDWSQEQVSVPVIEVAKQPASHDMGDGVMSCFKHPALASTWLCGACMKYYCATCPKNVRLVGRPPRWSCPECGGTVQLTPWADGSNRKQSLWKRLKNTFSRAR